MIWIKACPKCQGDLIASADIYGKYVSCLQCGREMVAAHTAPQKRTTSAWTREPLNSEPVTTPLVAA